MTRWGMAIDLRRCVGCQTCTIACKQAHNLPPGVFWRRVLDCETGSYPAVQRTFLPMACMHCADPPCMEVCPSTATRKRPDGVVTIDSEICVGCGYCVVACPYEARTVLTAQPPFFATGLTPPEALLADPDRTGTCTKCDFCIDRVEAGMAAGLTPGLDAPATPVCVNSCIAGAFRFGDLDDPASPVSQLLQEQEATPLLGDLGLGPAVVYVGAPAGPPLVPPRQQSVWGWQAVANFALGGAGAALYLLDRLAGPGSRLPQLVAPALVTLGLLALTTEAGRPFRGIHLFRHLGRSWMSREALAAAIFIPLAVAGLYGGEVPRWGAALAGAAFMVSQGFMLFRSRGVTAWNHPLMPALVVAGDLAGGAGLALLLVGGGAPGPRTLALTCGVISLGIWVWYLHPSAAAVRSALRELRTWPWLALVIGLGHLAPLLLLLVCSQPWAGAAAGLLFLAGAVLQKAGIVRRAGHLRPIQF